jgi:proline iminopeptidase
VLLAVIIVLQNRKCKEFRGPGHEGQHESLECHYFFHCGFFQHEGQLLRDLNRIRHIPTVIVQGRYDMPCPMRSAWDLHRAWPEADFRIVGDAGHSAAEAGITHELILSTDRFART